ncbi:androglobin-like isoform X7 [Ostrea edulis]|uniref:androglobin-like isoform X7 n=1 Tax=Ostrea edulis TaxID=37623 RepID=UPI0024AECF31|nr:androglobin-like isoform X7 [Ostrea edulis]
MSRRGSTPASSKKTSSSSKRVSLKDGNLLGGAYRQSLGDIREGDTFYKTVRFYPSLSELPDDVTINVARATRETRAGSSAGGAESRRGSVLSHDESASPSLGRTESPIKERAASIAASAGGADSKRPRALIWPEWNEKDVNDEKWDVVQKAKKEDKGKSPVAQQHYFDDPEGKIELPSSLKVETWRRPNEFITEKTPVIVDPDGMAGFDLLSSNEHIHHSELMRYIISQVVALWENTTEKNVPPEQAEPNQPYEEMIHSWRPWEHIYALMKVQKPPFVTPYNAYGKYVVKLYWMGCWRKLIVDDAMPFDENDKLLLPATSMQHELWPMLLTKALIKVASLDYTGGSQSSEFGDCSIIQCLTGWIPEAIPLQGLMSSTSPIPPGPASGSGRASPLVTASQVLDKYIQLSSQPKSVDTAAMPHGKAHKVKSRVHKEFRHGHIAEVWDLLKSSLPEWKLPLQEWEKQLLAEQQEQEKKELDSATPHDMTKDNLSEKDGAKGEKAEKADPKAKDGKDKGKDAKDKGGKDKDKKGGDKDKGAKGAEKEKTMDDIPVPDNPEVVVFATYWSTPKYPVKVSVLGEMADASEKLRQNGLSHIYPHPVCITQTRSCPLEPPPPPEKIPAWKLIRPKKKKLAPSDEPVSTPEPPKPIQCLEVTSPFLNYKVSPVPIPTDTTRPRSSLSRGGTRSRPATGNINQIEETDENAPEPEPKKPEPEKEEPPKMEEPPQIVEPEVKPSTPSKEKRKSPTKTKEGNREASPKGKRASSAKGEKPKSAGRPDSKGKKEEEKPAKVESVSGEYETSPPATPPAAAQPPPPSDGGGFAPPPPTDPDAVPLEGGEEGAEKPPEPQEEQVINEEAAKAKKVWMDFDMFCKCFKTLYIYHKPHTYKYNHKHADLKKLEKIYNIQSVTQAAAPVGKGDKKGGQGNVGAGGTIADERAPHYLFVDNLKPTEIVVCFSALSRWHDPPPQGIEEAKSHVNLKGKKGEQEKELTTVTSSSVMEEEPPDIKVDQDHSMEGSIVGESKLPPVVTPGTLVAEPYSWKSLVTGQPILRIRSTATKAAVLNLPAGRHVLRFMMSGPLGYSVHLVSTVPFVFGNEEEVMPELTKESCRFVDNALQVINSIGKCINTFTDTESFKKNWEELVHYHCPYRNDKLMSKQHHFEVFNDALYNMLRKCLSDVATPDIAFAWRCFTFDSTTKNILGLPTSSRPGTATTSHRGSAKPPGGGKDKEKEKDKGKQQQQQQTQHDGETEKVENPWANREPTPFEHTSAVKIQKNWKAFYVRKITQARVQGSEENTKVAENLQKCWNIIDPNAEQNGLFLFRFMFKNDPDIMVKYPFYQDEWNKISYADYSGTYTDQPPNNWFLVFREIFYVNEEMLAVPKLYVPVNTCLLRVVNNDNGEEIPRVFQKVAPYVYKKNKKGYSFVAEARTTDQGIPSNKWRMRLIGSLSPLPAPAKPDTVNSSFVVKHITDYYVPNSKDVIFRYTVKVTEDHLATVQINTSKLDVYIKLVILDNETEVATTQGKGHAVIPSFIFLKDFDPNEEKRPSSRASVKETKGKGGSKESVGKKRSGSGKSPEGRTSRPGSRHSDASEVDLEEKDYKPHKYIIQAMVLKNSWPLSESSWAFVQMLKDLEKNELKVANKERPPSPPKQEKTAASTSSKDKGKGGAKGKDKGKDKDQKGSRPSSQQFDHSKPHWNLRIASDASGADDIEVKKDTERADEIRALKRAWENAEEGRAVKAMQSRLKYLNMHTIKQDYDKEETEGGEEKPLDQEEVPPQTPLSLHGDQGDENLTLEPPPAPTPTEMLQQMDFSPFLKKPEREPRYLDDEEIRRREEEQKRQVEEYKAFRDQVKAWREQDKQKRNVTKIRQLEECEELQAMLDAARESVNAPREAIRQKYLEAERKKQEELEAKEAASLSDQTSKSPKGRKSAKGKKSPANGKKKGK